MRKLIAKFIKYPFYANLIIAILLLSGILGIMTMKMSFFPERASRYITVRVFYPGASPKEMEEGITTRIEESLRGIVGIKEITSTSSENSSFVNIETTGEYDLDVTLAEVKNAVDGISSFPTAAEKPIISKQRTTTPALNMGLFGDVDLITLKKYAEQIEDDFLASGLISQVIINGYPALEISVEVTENNLMRYNLTFDEISRAISMNNRDISAGMIKSEREEILIRARNRSVDPNKIAEIILRANPDGSKLRIRDIANVKMKFDDVASGLYINQKQAVSIYIRKLAEEDLQEITAFVENYAKEFNEKNQGVELRITWNFLEMLYSRLKLLIKNGGTGLMLVIISLGLFMSLRLSFWVAWGIPASFLGMFLIASFYGITINMISLFGMILVIGILVDDGIVIGENIFTHFEKGKTPMRAALDGTFEVMPAVITSILTTIIAFSPLVFIEGRMEFLFEMAFVVIVSLAVSLFEAFFVLPAHLASPKVLRRKKQQSFDAKIREKLDKAVNYMKFRIYGWLLRRIIKWKWITSTIPLAVLLITVGMFNGNIIKSTFFPSIPPDNFRIDIAFTPGSGELQTMSYLNRFDSIVWVVNKEMQAEYNETEPYVTYTSKVLGTAIDGMENGSHAGHVEVTLTNLEGKPVSSYEIAEAVRQKVGEVPEAMKFTIGGRNRWGKPVSISLLGKDLQELNKAKGILMNQLAQLPELNNITENNAAGKREVQLELKPEAYFLGLDQSIVTNQVRQGFFGGQSQRLQRGKDEIRVWVRYPKKDRLTLGQLENMKIKTQKGEYKLSDIASYKIERGPVSIKRYNAQREVRVDADLIDPYEPVPPILEKIEYDIMPEILAKHPGVRVLYQGQSKDSSETMGSLGYYFGIAFTVMVIVIMIHFKSAGQGLMILMMIPLGWIGSLWGHFFEGIPVSMLSTWGMVALSGVIINDAVVFLAKYNSSLLEGLKVEEAAYDAGIARFRAIILTTITTTIGLYPIIFEQSRQAQFLIPMAVSLAYGVLIGTAFILLFFPVLIITFNDIKLWSKFLWTGKRPQREELETALIDSKRVIQ